LLILVLSLLFLDLLGFNLLFGIILDSLVVGESLSLEGVLELENCFFLHGLGNFCVEDHVGDDASFDDNTFVTEVRVEMLFHTRGVLLTSEGVSFSCFDGSSHSSDSLHDIGVNCLIDLRHIGHKLLNVIGVRVDLQ
jgi:hypothetical protein